MIQSNIQYLIEVAEALGTVDIKSELETLLARSVSKQVPVVLPLVGEFSSGKTTLINALTDSHALETATRPVTSTLFEIHFGASSNNADIIYEDGREEHTEDISSLVNDRLQDVKVVKVYDKSKSISPDLILVDTPGISSTISKHHKVLVDFLPQADGIILVVDINQQVTGTLASFVKTLKLTNKAVYAVLTKSETKSAKEIEISRLNLGKESGIDIKCLAVVSALNGDLSELDSVLKDIESSKEQIIRKAEKFRLDLISEILLSHLKSLLVVKNLNPDNAIKEEIAVQRANQTRIMNIMDDIVRKVDISLREVRTEMSRCFEDTISEKLNSVLALKNIDHDLVATNEINYTASAVISDYRKSVIDVIKREISNVANKVDFSLSSLTEIDLTCAEIKGLEYNLNLNGTGHEYDTWIKTGVIAASALALTAATAGGGVPIGSMIATDSLFNTSETPNISAIGYGDKQLSHMDRVIKYGQSAMNKYSEIEMTNQRGIGISGCGKGLIDSAIWTVVERTKAKPQRKRAVRKYLEEELIPEFNKKLESIGEMIIDIVKDTVVKASEASLEEIEKNLGKLKSQLELQKDVAIVKLNKYQEMYDQILKIQLN